MAVACVASNAFGQTWGDFWPSYFGGSTYSTESVPYYALHPPVYYSFRVPRTYGYSPYAYPGAVLTPGSVAGGWVSDGYAWAESDEGKQSPKPLRINNPFVRQGEKGPTASAAPTRSPKVIYPARLAQHKK